MVDRRRRLGKYREVRFVDPPWDEEHPDWKRLDQDLPADHVARRIVEFVEKLDLSGLWSSYGAGGTSPIRPDLMLRMILIEYQQGRMSPSQWCSDAREHTPLMWAGMGIRPSRTCCYEFAERITPYIDQWNWQVLQMALAEDETCGRRASLDGSTMAANASRHHLLNEERLQKKQDLLQQACTADAQGEALESVPGWMAKTSAGRSEQFQRMHQAWSRLEELHAVNDRQIRSCRRPRKKVVVSASDPQAGVGRDKLHVFRPLYNTQLVSDLDSPLILGYEVFAQAGDEGTFKPTLNRVRHTFGIWLETLLTDGYYATACHLAYCQSRGMTLYAPWPANGSSAKAKEPKYLPKDLFEWTPEQNAYRCPEGHLLTAIGKEQQIQTDGEVHTIYRYRCAKDICQTCPLRKKCTGRETPARGRSVRRSEHEVLVAEHKARMQTEAAKTVYRLRSQTVERGFADFKQHRNLRCFSGRGLIRARRQVGLTVLMNNLLAFSKMQKSKPALLEAA